MVGVASLRKGVAQHTIWLVFGMIVLVLTGALFYVIFPRSDCDRLAELSAQEIKGAIECAAKYDDGKSPVTGKKCNEATVKLCQEDSFSIFGVGYVQAYMGLMVPEYMIYYQKFPTQRYKGLLEGPTIGFTESYPFERAYHGQRPYDFRPTLTQFKQFIKTKYLQEACTSDQGLCFNIRGREEVVRVDGVIPDVRLQRAGVGFAETNPKFYVVSPCHAKVKFTKGGDGKIYGRPMKYSTPGASNYCFMDEVGLMALIGTYTGEASCEIGMIALDIVTLSGKKAVEESAEAGATVGIKVASKKAAKKIGKEVAEAVMKKFGRKLGKKAQREATEQATKRVIGKMLVKEFEGEFAQEMVEISVRKGIKKVLTESGEEIAPEVQEKIVKEVTEQVLKETTEETLESAMEKAVDRGLRKANRQVFNYVSEEAAPKLIKEATEEAIEAGISGSAEKIVSKGLSSGAKAKIVGRAALRRYGTMEGLRPGNLLLMFGAIPCLDVDLCRAASACGEAMMWPGAPNAELIDKHMKGGKMMDTVSDVFFECCNEYNYGAESDPEKIMCTEPDYLVELIKPELAPGGPENVTLAQLADYIQLPRDRIPESCQMAIGENSKDCRDAIEIRELKLTDNCGADVSEHTYDFGGQKSAGQITAMARLFEDECGADIIIELSNDTKDWIEANRTAALQYPEDNFVYVFGQSAFRYLKIREDGVCYFDTSSVVLDPIADKVIEAEQDTRYGLTPGSYNYFIVPENYTGKASTLCKSVEHCTTMAKWIDEEGAWMKWADEGGGPMGEDFVIMERDKIGIYTEKASEVFFKVGE